MSAQAASATAQAQPAISFFERWLTVWVFLCIVAGIALGQALAAIADIGDVVRPL